MLPQEQSRLLLAGREVAFNRSPNKRSNNRVQPRSSHDCWRGQFSVFTCLCVGVVSSYHQCLQCAVFTDPWPGCHHDGTFECFERQFRQCNSTETWTETCSNYLTQVREQTPLCQCAIYGTLCAPTGGHPVRFESFKEWSR